MLSKADIVEPLDVREPPGQAMGKIAELARPLESGKIVCTACARYCKIGEGQVGLCGVRGVHDGKLWLYVYGRVITGHVDPIEKKPVSHYRPGSKIFSIATTGCNWLCHPAGTPILMADGEVQPVEEIRPGDALASVGSHGTFVPDIVTAMGSRRARTLAATIEGVREPLLATLEHPLLTQRGWVPLVDINEADFVLTVDKRSSGARATPREFPIPEHGPAFHPSEMKKFWTEVNAPREIGLRYRWKKVRAIRPEAAVEDVYSFECVPFHNYVVNDVVAHNCRYCFLPGTMVLTESGHQPIESIFAAAEPTENTEVRLVQGRRALTHRGRWMLVKKAFEHLYSGRVLAIRPYYLPAFECTPDHRVYAAIGGGAVRRVKADELKVGDFLAIPRQKPSGDLVVDVESLVHDEPAPPYRQEHRIEVTNGRVRWSSERGVGVPARLQVNPAVARILGYYCAEGSVNWHPSRPNSGAVWFSFGSHEEDRIREVEHILHSEFHVSARRVRQENRVAVIAPGASLATLFRRLCGESSATKRVPEVILRATDSQILRGFLSGYFNGDGYVTQLKTGRLVLGSSSVSSALTYGVAQLLLTLGDIPRVYRARNPPTHEIEGRTVSRSDDIMLRLWVDAAELNPREATWQASKVRVIARQDYLLIPIRSIDEKEYVGPVYNIEVEEDHSYTANFMAVANCQNFDISQRRKVEGIEVVPQDVVKMTLDQGCQGLAYTYNQPTIFIEFARDIGMAARRAGLINIFVSNGYDTPEAVAEMPKFLDCITVDFKGSGETKFVQRYIGIPNADPIFQTIKDLRDTKKIHIEITDLIVPQVGDDLEAARRLSKFVYDELGPDTPIHFLRFHPDYKMMEFPWTPVETLEKHCDVAKEAGLKYVYVGNVPGHPLEHTYCPGCAAIAIRRYGFDITGWYLDKNNRCKKCGYQLAISGSLEKTFKDDRFYSVLHHR